MKTNSVIKYVISEILQSKVVAIFETGRDKQSTCLIIFENQEKRIAMSELWLILRSSVCCRILWSLGYGFSTYLDSVEEIWNI